MRKTELKYTFNEDALNYDKSRPGYPEQLYHDIFDYCCISDSCNVLEIGIGTGQATEPFLRKGCNIKAVELGGSLAEFSRKKFSQFKNIEVINADFLECEFCKNHFDLIYSATAFHWIPKERGYHKILNILKPGGAIALFWNHPFPNRKDDSTNAASMRVYAKYRPDDNHGSEFSEKNCEKIVSELKQFGFTDVQSKIYHRTRNLDTQDYINLINTYSDHRALCPEIKSSFEREMTEAVNAAGGHIKIYDTIDLYLARKP